MPEIQTIKISELPETSNLNGLRTLGTTADNQSVAAQLQAVADATANANDAATQAQEAAQTANEAAQTANTAASAANQATDNVIDAINKTEAAYTNATAAAESANEAAAAANSAADQAIGFINSAQTAVDNANTAANAANEAATTATNAANNANTQAEYAKEQGDYAKQQGDAVLAQKGQPNGLAELDSTGRVPASQLPSYVDDVIDVDTYDDLPNPGESGKIYITTDTNLQYRWSGTCYAEISPSLALGTTSETAGRGDWTQAAYDHSLITNGSNPHKTTFSSLPDAPTSLPANGGNAESAVKDGDGNIITANYFKLLPDKVSDLNNVPINTFFVSSLGPSNSPASYAAYVNGFCVASDNNSTFKKQLVYADDWYVRSQGNGTWGEWRKIWHSGNFNPSNYLSTNNTTAYTPTSQYNPATKGYVDSLAGTYILDMDNILAYISSSGSTPISQSNSQILQSIQSSVLNGNMPRAFGKYTVQNNEDPAYPANSSISWQLTDAATFDEMPGAVYMSFTCLAGASSGPKVRTLTIIVLADGQVMSSGDSGWWSAGGSSGGLVIPASGEQAATGWTYNGKQVYVQRFSGSFTGAAVTNQYATVQIPNLSFIVMRNGTVSFSNNIYEIGDDDWNIGTGESTIKSNLKPIYGSSGSVQLHIYDANSNSGWQYEFWLAYTK